MKLIKMIYYYVPRILVGLFVMCAAIYMFFTHGIFFGVLTALIPVAVGYGPKHMKESIREIDESGDHGK